MEQSNIGRFSSIRIHLTLPINSPSLAGFPGWYPVGVQRDMDLIRDILCSIADNPELNGSDEKAWGADELGLAGRTDDEVGYHLVLLIESGYVVGDASTPGVYPTISRLTMEGHDFYGSIQDSGIWGKTKERIKDLPGIALTAVAGIALAEAKKRLGLA